MSSYNFVLVLRLSVLIFSDNELLNIKGLEYSFFFNKLLFLIDDKLFFCL